VGLGVVMVLFCFVFDRRRDEMLWRENDAAWLVVGAWIG
jgi:hypothetical protein